MDGKTFKKTFSDVACQNGFEHAFGGWFKESNECIVALMLQRSNYGNYFDLNIKVFIQGSFGAHYSKSKELLNGGSEIIFKRQPKEYNHIFNLELPIEDGERKEELEKFFRDFVDEFSENSLTKNGINALDN